MAAQQRYTPVPGMGPRPQSGYELDNFYDGDIPAAHRLSSYATSPPASRPVSTSSTAPFAPVQPRYTDNPTSQPYQEHYSNPYTDAAAISSSSMVPPMAMASNGRYGTRLGSTQSLAAHQSIPSESYYPQSDRMDAPLPYTPNDSKRKRNRWLLIGGIIFAVVAVIGIIAGVVVSQLNRNKSNGSSSSAAAATTSGSTTLSNPSDPSSFTKDSRLKQSFWGFAYTPNLAQVPWCGVTQTNVTRDIQLLSQLTTRIRLYGANCNQTAMVMQAIQDTKVNMTVWVAIYVDSNTTAYDNQLTAIEDVLKTYGTDHISGITVGNEYILNTAGTSSTTSAIYTSAVSDITKKVASVKSIVKAMGLSKTLPIGTSDAGSILSKTLASGIDYFMANVHPWFGSVAIQNAAAWTDEFYQEFDVDIAATASNKPTTYIAETGWPTASMNASDISDGAGSPQGDASVANLQTFLDTFVCQANKNGTEYFFFEAFDEPWKAQFGGVEPYWGLFDSNRNLKNVTIPSC